MFPKTDAEAVAMTMVGEARGEGLDGMQDVGQTIVNRVSHPSWRGRAPLEVCLKPWQYSCWNEKDPNREYLLNMQESDPWFKIGIVIAHNLLLGKLPDRTNGATYYFRIGSATPLWAVGKKPCYKSGHHLFFKDIS